MTSLSKYHAADLSQLMEKIHRNSIGMDDYFDRIFSLHETTTKYPPYNVVTVHTVASRLDLNLAGYKTTDV